MTPDLLLLFADRIGVFVDDTTVEAVDAGRVGIMGGSYGGYLTAWAIAHDHRFPREYNWRPIVAHALFWNYPVPGSGTEEDARASAEMLERARDLNSGVRSVASKTTRNRSVIDLVSYELSRAEWMFDSVIFSVKANTDHALRLADELRRLKDDYVRLWNATNILQGRQRVEVRFDKLIGLYENEAQGLTPWNGVWRPALRMQTGPHPL